MKKYTKLFSLLTVTAMICSFSACSQNNTSENSSAVSMASSAESSSEESKTQDSIPSESKAQESSSEESKPDESTQTESVPVQSSITETSEEVSTYGLENYAHPDYMVGKWSLVLETSDLTSEQVSEAEDRMKSTSMVLAADGTATGIYNESRIKGAWGEQNGYVFVSFGGDEPETFGYYVDTLVSLNYHGMSFVK